MEVYKKRKPSFYPVHCYLITIWMMKMLCESKPLSFLKALLYAARWLIILKKCYTIHHVPYVKDRKGEKSCSVKM
ncbi:hypothetical protein BVY13_13835 [Bacillus amyloliquefaciens]|nr:hypothetical protein BVY13_13835 [Bacillus amyloliquefaciens]